MLCPPRNAVMAEPRVEHKLTPATVESIVSQAQTIGKQAYDADVGSTESK